MKIIEKAINFAAKAHDGQMRKSTNVPYITHPFAVGMLLQQLNCSEEVIAAGILHDTIEDTEATYEQLVQEFGEKIANFVQAASEHDKSLPWEERKQHTIHSLASASLEEIQIIIADKLHNLRSIREELESQGDVVWSRFNRGKAQQHWYYSSIVKAVLHRKEEYQLIEQLEEEVQAVFG
ncbi:HD domain-containing protein [Ureibacillus xyleni]|uniref:HD domain-containing protein n=1 Tax=Ureibacillus xyleni TaxID=614648 RepID=A0A285SXF3_9BACL|nr:HD domain-containing protein [Ureibacillus xyleni]SOC11164.1 HD domain-containing protein [Ureibacillus xyleni]